MYVYISTECARTSLYVYLYECACECVHLIACVCGVDLFISACIGMCVLCIMLVFHVYEWMCLKVKS